MKFFQPKPRNLARTALGAYCFSQMPTSQKLMFAGLLARRRRRQEEEAMMRRLMGR
jgi:hypothetical protein